MRLRGGCKEVLEKRTGLLEVTARGLCSLELSRTNAKSRLLLLMCKIHDKNESLVNKEERCLLKKIHEK